MKPADNASQLSFGPTIGDLLRHSSRLTVVNGIAMNTVSQVVMAEHKATGQLVPCRGTIHDMGRSVTHKAVICYKRLVESTVGELDFSILLAQYFDEARAMALSPHWKGGTYALYEN